MPESHSHSKLLYTAALVFAVSVIATLFFVFQDVEHLRDMVRELLETARSTGWSYPIVLGLYLLSSVVMFPIIVMNLATAMVFGPVWGFLYAMSGSLLSATVFFYIGRFGRDKGLKKLLSGPRLSKIDSKLKDSGVIGIAILRLIPMAPFGIFNMAAGITSVRFIDYIAGTFIGFLPGGVARAVVGDSLVQLFLNPSQKTAIYLGCGIALWLTIILALHFGLKKYRASTA